MHPFRRAIFLFLALLLALAGRARAQQAPHIGYAFPAGGRQGSSFDVVIGGQNLAGAADAFVTGTGVKAAVTDYYRTLPPGQYNNLRDQLRLLLARKDAASGPAAATQPAGTRPVWTAADDAKVADLRKRLSKPPKRIDNPALSETVTLHITIDGEAAPGDRELRLRTLTGLTNPILFCVDQLPEFSAKEIRGDLKGSSAISLPAIVNGQIMPGEADQFHFKASKGQHLVIAAAARALIPYLSDAVPGWFQAAVSVFDSRGREAAFADHFRFDPDPVIYFEVPETGEYTLEIHDSIYRGREDFVYRITLGEIPYITGIFPMGVEAGGKTTVELTGWNLPSNSMTFDASAKVPGVYPISMSKGTLASNRVPFAVDALREITAQKSGDTPATAQSLTLPVIVNGRIGRPGDTDLFSFQGQAGEEFVAEVTARRLNSPLDSVLQLTDSSGKQIAFNDDHEDKASALNTHYADSYLHVTLPASGTYFLRLADAQHKGGPDFTYRLRLSSPHPDFALRVTPSSISVRGGTSVPVNVYALRKDGFAGEIAINLKDAPAGFSLSGAKIPAKQDQVTLTLKAPAGGSSEPLNLALEGRATIAGQSVIHAAVPAEDMMQAFAYHHLVPAQELLVNVSARNAARNNARILSPAPVRFAPGAAVTLKCTMPTETLLGKIELELTEPAEGMILQSVSPIPEGSEFVLKTDAAKLKPGLKGNLIISIFLVREAPAAAARTPTAPANPAAPAAAAPAAKRRVPMGSFPAVPFEVTGP